MKSEPEPANPSPSPVFGRIPNWRGAGLSLFLFLLTLEVFLPATANNFLNYDDQVYVTQNLHVQQGLTRDSLKWAFSTAEAATWHPLTWISHMLDYELFGLKPWGHHFTGVLLHALNSALLFLVLLQMSGALWRSFFVAAIFGLHPLRVESVAWIAERKDVLSVFFWMLTMLAYTRYVRAPKTPDSNRHLFYSLTLLCFTLGLLSKPMVVTLPFVLLLLDFWPLNRLARSKDASNSVTTSWLRLILEKIPFFLLAAASSAATLIAQQKAAPIRMLQPVPESARIGNALVSYCRYLGKLFWPANLSPIYPLSFHWPLVNILLAVLFLVGVSIFVIALRHRQPFLLVGWFWYLGTLVPVIGFVQGGDQALADRYTYVPSVGVLILVGWGAFELAKRFPRPQIILSLTALLIILPCLLLTRRQIAYWKDTETLFGYALEKASSMYRQSIAANPDDSRQRINFGVMLSSRGQLDEAAAQLQEAVRLAPASSVARDNLGTVLILRGDLAGAIGQFQEVLRLQPDDPDAHAGLGTAHLYTGKLDEAINQLKESIRLYPGNALVHGHLGDALFRTGGFAEAATEFEKSLELDPSSPQMHGHLGLALAKMGRRDEAIAQFQQALKLKPDYAQAEQQLRVLTNSAAP